MTGNRTSTRAYGLPPWAIWAKVAMALVIIAAVSIAGCGMQVNQVPVINSLAANPSTVSTGGSSTITCNATDADGDTLTYTWSSTAGTITGAGGTVTWQAPSIDGTYTITVVVADGKGGTATNSVSVLVEVVAPVNNPPVITSVVAASPSVPPGGTTGVTCTATDADGDTLTYYWSASLGSFSGTGNIVTWQAPMTQGIYSIQTTVEDGRGGNDTGSTNVEVAVVVTAGSINVQSSPTGAKVFLDGVDTGSVTPYIINNVPAGPHTIKLRKTNYKDRQEVVVVTSGVEATINWALTYTAPTTVTIQPNAAAGKDSYVYQGSPADNRGTDDQVCAAGGVGTACRLFIQFDLSTIPSTAVVTSGRLDLYYHSNAGGALQGPVGAYQITQSWDEGTITWNNQPTVAVTATVTTTIPAVATNSFRNWYITDLVQGWIDTPAANYGVMLADTDESTAEKYKCFRSSDWGTALERPKLIIQYYDPAP